MTQKDWLRPWTQQESFYRGQVRELLFHRLGSEALLQPQLLSSGGNWVLALCSWPWSNIHDLYFLWVSLFFHIFCLNKRLECGILLICCGHWDELSLGVAVNENTSRRILQREKDLHYRETDTFSHLLWQMTEDIHKQIPFRPVH